MSPGSDGISEKLFKYGGENEHTIIHEICSRIWETEKLSTE